MITTKVLFMDIDGPMIPLRAYGLSTHKCPVDTFDPCATNMVMQLLNKSSIGQQTKIVCSSTWGNHGHARFEDLLEKNGINHLLLHVDWVTPRKMSSSRSYEIAMWLDKHPEITHYVAVDDEHLDQALVPNAVLCDAYEGFSFRNFMEAKLFLGILDEYEDREKVIATINYHKQREIWRATDRMSSLRSAAINDLTRQMFDPIDKDLSC